jgi:hypothetical protein
MDDGKIDYTEENDLMLGLSRDILLEYSQENFPNMSDDDSVRKIPRTLPRRERT